MNDKEYEEHHKKVVEEIKAENQEARTKKMLQEAMDKAGLDITITGKVKWKPGDPVTNNAELMLQNEWEDNATEEELKAVNTYLFKDKDGITRDMRFCAPERFPEEKE